MTKKIIIKRYGNRRLYNSETRSYVKLLDIAEFIRDGAEIQVLDSRTGEDITKLVLTQIILEEEKSKKDLLPLNFLYDLIRHQQGWVQEFFQRHVVKALENVLPPRRSELLSNLRQSLDFRSASTGFFDRLLHRGEPSDKSGPGSSAAPLSAEAALVALEEEAAELVAEVVPDETGLELSRSALGELLQRLEAIESRMSRIESSLPRPGD